MSGIEAWLDGPVEGVPPLLMPVAHALIQTHQDLEGATTDLTVDEVWTRPGGAASVGFHLRHIAGSTDRLLTYALGDPLAPDQIAAIKLEGTPGAPPASAKELLASVARAVDAALAVLRETPAEQLLEFRGVGKAQRPSDVIGLCRHAGQHGRLHVGDDATPASVLRGRSG